MSGEVDCQACRDEAARQRSERVRTMNALYAAARPADPDRGEGQA